MGLFKSKKQKEEELLQLRQAKCEQLIKIGFFGISKTPLDVTTVAEHKAEVEADIMDYLIMQEQLMGKKLYFASPVAMLNNFLMAQAIGSTMYHVYGLTGYADRKKTISALNSIIFGELLSKDSRFNTIEEDFFAYKDWITEKLTKELAK